jgi:hypothetical protein
MSRAARGHRPITATEAAIDPALRPFFDAIAELLVAEELRLADARRTARVLAASAKGKPTK